MSGKPSDSAERLPESLTTREQEILVYLADGLSNQEIANKLYLAAQTVRWYNSQIYGKLGVSSRSEAIERAEALGLLHEASPAVVVTGKHNLPVQTTAFVGREHELVELAMLLKDENTHLITILAPGGMGKTRLALEAARLQIGCYADGVIFVPLAPLSVASDIVTTIAENIGFSFYGEQSPARQLTDFLRERSMLLVLDNFEHLLDGTQLVADLMQAASNIRLLTTSRERLNLRGETVYSLRGLEFPTWETPEDALQYDAVKLFMQSAHRVRLDFELQAADLDHLARICRLTAGMPLGLELAAGWADVLPLEQIATEIQKGIDILETEMRDVPERQRSVRATFNQTWERLTADEQAIFMRLSIFRGGFSVQSAQMVAGAGIRSLRQLTSKALVQVSPNGRYDIHELLRQFGAEKLGVSGEQPAIQAKHAAFFADFMAERGQDMRGKLQIEALKLIDPDFENVRSAWLYIVNHQEWDQLPKFLYSLWLYFDLRTRGRGAVELLEPAVKLLQSVPVSAETDLALGRVLARLCWFTHDLGFWEMSATMCDEAIRILRQHESPDDLMMALHNRALQAWFQKDSTLMLAISREGLRMARLMGDKNRGGAFLSWMGLSYIYNDVGLALQYSEASFSILDALEDHAALLTTVLALSIIKELQKDYKEAERWIAKGQLLAQSLGHLFLDARSYVAKGKVLLAQQDYAGARTNLGKGLQLYWDAGYSWVIAFPLVYIVQFWADQNEVERAVELRAAIDRHLVYFEETDVTAEAIRIQLETQMEPERFAAAWARGQKRELATVVAEILKAFNTV